MFAVLLADCSRDADWYAAQESRLLGQDPDEAARTVEAAAERASSTVLNTTALVFRAYAMQRAGRHAAAAGRRPRAAGAGGRARWARAPRASQAPRARPP